MELKRALLGLAWVVALATTVILWIFAAFDRYLRGEFERHLERVEWVGFGEFEWLGTWTHGLDSLTLLPGGRCRYEEFLGHHDVIGSEVHRGTWEPQSDGQRALRCKKGPASLRSGRLEGEPVLVSEGRTWQRRVE